MAVTTSTPPQWSGVHRLPGLEGRIPRRRRKAIVLTTLGSLGDLYPVLSVARALEAKGVEARLALSPHDCETARRWGLLAAPIGPSEAEVTTATGLTRDQIAAQTLHDMGPILRDVAFPAMSRILADLAPICAGADLVTGTFLALAAPLAAEQQGVPFVPLALQPFMTLSPEDPPHGRGFGLAFHPARAPWQRNWNSGVIGLLEGVFRWRHRRDLDRLRAELGLRPSVETPVLRVPGDVPLTLGLWSEVLAPLPADRADTWALTGFPPAPEGVLPPEAEAWLRAGPPPLVVTLGSVAQGIAGPQFWTEAVALARRLGLRAVLLHGQAAVPTGPDLLALPYGAHAPLFPQAAAILHHGGIGTSAEALRAGKPQLVVPIGGDQTDNAARLTALGVAAALPAQRFRADRAERALTRVLDRVDHPRMGALADQIAAEDGAAKAAEHLIGLISGP